MLLSIVGRGGMGIRTTDGKNTLDTKHISAHGSTHDQKNHVQIQPTPSPLHCDLEHIRIPSTKLFVCVCVCAHARACVCDIYFKSCISQVKLYKIHGRYYVERGSVFSSSFFFFFFFFFSFFLITSNINIIGSSSFYSRITRKIKKKKKN